MRRARKLQALLVVSCVAAVSLLGVTAATAQAPKKPPVKVTVNDFYLKYVRPNADQPTLMRVSRQATIFWGVAQIAVAWVLSRGEDIVPLVGARTRERLTESLGALDVTLDADDLAAIERAVPPGAAAGARYPEPIMAHLGTQE